MLYYQTFGVKGFLRAFLAQFIGAYLAWVFCSNKDEYIPWLCEVHPERGKRDELPTVSLILKLKLGGLCPIRWVWQWMASRIFERQYIARNFNTT